tara:strand:+ start:3224 stop:6232 length:3009 start_codon:yes stop_codon:yes gene_type:complete
MMAMSAFVVIPTYNVGAMDSDDDEGEDDGGPESIDVAVDMIALDEWTVSVTAEMPATSSDEMRQGIAWMCGDMIGTSDDEITEACFNHWIEMIEMESDDGDHGEDGCPSGLSDEQCDDLRDCFEGEGGGPILGCFRTMYDICGDENPYDFCYTGDELMDFFDTFFAYEDEDIGPDEFMAVVMSLFNSSEGPGDDDDEVWLYDIQTFTIGAEDAGYHSIYPNLYSFPWGGRVYLYSGHLQDPDNTSNLIAGIGEEQCQYTGTNELNVECSNYWEGNLPTGDYSLLTAARCYNEWTDENEDGEDDSDELDCGIYSENGSYVHAIPHLQVIGGTIYGSICQAPCGPGDSPMMELKSDHHESHDYSRQNFPLFDTYQFTVGEDGLNGSIVSAHYICYDNDGEVPDDCSGTDMSLYLYEYSFNPDDTGDNLLSSNRVSEGNGQDCPVVEEGKSVCDYSRLEVELTEGNYVVVTAGGHTYAEGSYVNRIVNQDGITVENHIWDGTLQGSHCDYLGWDGIYLSPSPGMTYDDCVVNEGQQIQNVSLDGDGSIFVNFTEEFETDGEGDDLWIKIYMLNSTIADWDEIDGTGLDNGGNHSNFTCHSYWCDEWDGESILRIALHAYGVTSVVIGLPGSAPNDWSYANAPVVAQGDDRAYMPWAEEYGSGGDPHWQLYMDMIVVAESYEDGTSTSAVAAEEIRTLVYQADAMGLYNQPDSDENYDTGMSEDECNNAGGDYHENEEGEDGTIYETHCHLPSEHHGEGDNGDGSDQCPFDDDEFCSMIGRYCNPEDPDYDPEHCGTEAAHYCLEDGADDEGCTDEIIEEACENEDATEEICEAYLNFDHDAYHSEDMGDHVLLDGIIAKENPADFDLPILSTNVIGPLSDNEGLPMMMGGSFVATFDGADDTLAHHTMVLPGNDEPIPTSYTFTLLEGYQFDSCLTEGADCTGLEVDDDGRTFHFDGSEESATIGFSPVSPEPEPLEEDGGILPGPGLIAAMISFFAVAVLRRRI